MEYSPEVLTRFFAKIQVCLHGEACQLCCWLWQGARKATGYGSFRIGRDVATRKDIVKPAHRFAWEIHHKTSLPSHIFVCHACDCPPCCQPAHLWSGTPKDNSQDAQQKGRMAFGERNGWRLHPESYKHGEEHHLAKLTTEAVVDIVASRGQESQTSIAARHGVSPSLIGQIYQGKAWKHFPRELFPASASRGESHALSKLTAADIARIFALRGTCSQRALAQQFGVSEGTISHLFHGKHWGSALGIPQEKD